MVSGGIWHSYKNLGRRGVDPEGRSRSLLYQHERNRPEAQTSYIRRGQGHRGREESRERDEQWSIASHRRRSCPASCCCSRSSQVCALLPPPCFLLLLSFSLLACTLPPASAIAVDQSGGALCDSFCASAISNGCPSNSMHDVLLLPQPVVPSPRVSIKTVFAAITGLCGSKSLFELPSSYETEHGDLRSGGPASNCSSTNCSSSLS